MKKVLFLANTSMAIFGLRGEIIQRLKEDNFEIITAFQSGLFGDGEKIANENKCKFIEVKINRRGKNPFNDLFLLYQYIKLIKKEKPDVILSFNVKCNIYGGIAARFFNVPFFPNITGLGKGLVEDELTKKITIFLYKCALKKAKCIFFQNENDKAFFEKNIPYKNGVLLPGSGVNIKKFIPHEYPKDDKIRFLFISRVMKVKGIDEFLEAAQELKNDNIEFHVCGYCEDDYKDILDKYSQNRIIEYHGLVNNVEDYIKNSSCIVLPSFHPEGIANVLLEAAAIARPIITTNRIGCKETIINNESGFLIEEKNAKDLIEKMKRFIELPMSEKELMGKKGRKHIEENFNRDIVVKQYYEQIKNVI